MSNPISEEELQVAEELLTAVLTLRQFGEEGLNPERSWHSIELKIEHFLRRAEPESAYYERFGDHDVTVCGPDCTDKSDKHQFTHHNLDVAVDEPTREEKFLDHLQTLSSDKPDISNGVLSINRVDPKVNGLNESQTEWVVRNNSPLTVAVKTQEEAFEVLRRMRGLISQYIYAKVADLLDLIGVPTNYTDEKYGWTGNLEASIHPIQEGYAIIFPTPIALDL